MNKFFENCPDLDARQVQEFELLSCVHVHRLGMQEKYFSIFCDDSFYIMENAGENETIKSPRYSSIQYVSMTDATTIAEGQVVGIVSYTRTKKKKITYLSIDKSVSSSIRKGIFKAIFTP